MTLSCALRIVTAENAPTWNDYVSAHPKGSIFHRVEMVKVYRNTPRYEPMAVAAVDSSDRILALLVAVRIETARGPVSRFASRSIQYAEPLCDDTPAGIAALQRLLRHHDTAMQGRTLFAEVRPQFSAGPEREPLEVAGHTYLDYLNYVVDLSPDVERVWSGVSKSCRHKIRRSHRQGVEVRIDNSHEGVARMYEMVRISFKRSGVPLPDVDLFHHALDILPEGSVAIRLAWHDDSPVAGGIALIDKGTVFAWYGGSKRLSGIAPFDCLTWEEIEWGCNNGQFRYDFGGAGWPDQPYGPRDFKAKFGGNLVRYGRYRKVYAKRALRVAETIYETVRRFNSLVRVK